MADTKTERLVNLTLALLASKRFLKKSEILRTVAGYEGSAESMDRMFERDKDDLRALGIEIEVGDLDAFFEDEPGYRISRDSYSLEVPGLSPREIAYLSLAANFWKDSTLTPAAQSGIRKLKSLGIPAAMDLASTIEYRFENPKIALLEITEAIDQSRQLEFEYQSEKRSKRRLAPYRVLLWNGFWYLVGQDLEKEEIRMFKLSRVIGDIKAVGKKGAFLAPVDFDVRTVLPTSAKESENTARVAIRKGEAITLRANGKLVSEGESVDTYEIDYDLITPFLRRIIWYGDSVEIIEPIELRNQIMTLIGGLSQ
jgi:proteasome accessory factor B